MYHLGFEFRVKWYYNWLDNPLRIAIELPAVRAQQSSVNEHLWLNERSENFCHPKGDGGHLIRGLIDTRAIDRTICPLMYRIYASTSAFKLKSLSEKLRILEKNYVWFEKKYKEIQRKNMKKLYTALLL